MKRNFGVFACWPADVRFRRLRLRFGRGRRRPGHRHGGSGNHGHGRARATPPAPPGTTGGGNSTGTRRHHRHRQPVGTAGTTGTGNDRRHRAAPPAPATPSAPPAPPAPATPSAPPAPPAPATPSARRGRQGRPAAPARARRRSRLRRTAYVQAPASERELLARLCVRGRRCRQHDHAEGLLRVWRALHAEDERHRRSGHDGEQLRGQCLHRLQCRSGRVGFGGHAPSRRRDRVLRSPSPRPPAVCPCGSSSRRTRRAPFLVLHDHVSRIGIRDGTVRDVQQGVLG